MPPEVLVPRCLQRFERLRWQQRTPLDVVEGLPVWSPAILVAYMAAWPSNFDFDDAGEWLPVLCGAVDTAAMRGELADRPRSVWMKAAFVMWRGGRDDVAAALAGAAPGSSSGPYKFGSPTGRWAGRTHSDFDVVDYTFVRDWHDHSDHFINWGSRPQQPATRRA